MKNLSADKQQDKKLVLHLNEQQQIQAMLQQTVITDSKYVDNQINYLLNPNHNTKQKRSSMQNSIHSQLSAVSEPDENFYVCRDNSMESSNNRDLPGKQSSQEIQNSDQQYVQNGRQFKTTQKQESQDFDINQSFLHSLTNSEYNLNTHSQHHSARFDNLRRRNNFPYKQLYAQLQQLQTAYTLQQVNKQFPSFLVSKPMCNIQSTVNQQTVGLNSALIQKGVRYFDVNSERNQFYLAVGTNSNCVVIYQLNSNKPLQIVQVFRPGQTVKTLKWSKSMQYLIVANNNMEVKVFQSRQFVQTQASIQLKWIKNPIQMFTVQNPKIKTNIISCHFIQQNPVKVLIVDQEYEIYIVQMKKHILSFKPYITKLPIKFNQFFQVKTKKFCDQQGKTGILLMVGGQQYVTLAIIEPKFQVILVYDKEKHFPQARSGGFPNISFLNDQNQPVSSSSQILTVWDKHMQILNVRIESFQPFTFKIFTELKYTFADSTVLLYNMSDTLVYQLTRLELKIYSLSQLSKHNNNSKFSQIQTSDNEHLKVQGRRTFAEPIFVKKIRFQSFPQGDRVEEIISNRNIQLQDLRYMKGLFSVANHNLFLCFEENLLQVSIWSFPRYIQNTIESINDWKVGLQLLNQAIGKRITNFDNIKPATLKKQLRQYSSRYIQFLKGVIPDIQSNNEIWRQQICFLFNILIKSYQQSYLLKQILLKLYRISPQLLRMIQPFILLGQINSVEVDTLDLLFSVVDRKVARRIVYSLKNSSQLQGQDQNQLAHMINNVLIRYQMWLEIIWVNQFFADWYTPFVVIVSVFEKKYAKKDAEYLKESEEQIQRIKKIKQNKQELESQLQKFKQDKKKMIKLMSYLTFDTFRFINASQYDKFGAYEDKFHLTKTKAKYLLETLIPLMNLKLNNILIHDCPQQFFDFIMQELFSGNCLQILLELESMQSQKVCVLSQIVGNISFRSVVQSQAQGKYWLFLMRLMIRKLVQKKIISGIYYLTLQYPYQSQTLIRIVDKFVKECPKTLNQELYSMELQKKTELFQKLQSLQYTQLLKLLGKCLSRQIQVLQSLIKIRSCHSVQLIEYMIQIIESVQFQPQQRLRLTLYKLKQILKANIQLFVSIDPEKTSSLIIQHYKNQMKEFISYLNSNPKQQLGLLKQILMHYNYGEFLNKEKCKYLQLLAINSQKQMILTEIKQHMFPLDQAIQICKKYDVLDAWAFLLVKSGGSGNAIISIQIYFRLIKQHIDNYKYNRKTYERWLQLRKLMLNELDKCIEICINLDLKGNCHYQTEWFFVIQQLEQLKKHIYKTCSPEVESSVKQIINDALYPQLIRELLDQVTQENLVDYLNKSINQLQIQAVELIIEQMVKSYFYQKQILKNAQHEISQCEISKRKKLFQQVLKGFITTSRCHECMKQDIQTKIHYSCGHDIHPSCNQDVKECISCRSDIASLISKQINLKDKVQKQIYYNSMDSRRQISAKQTIRLSRQQKLRQYDQFLAKYNLINC